MFTIHARNVNGALLGALRTIREVGVPRNTRNGPVLQAPVPVTTCYERPAERVLFWEWRDANPFFHLVESLWMLAGRDDVATVARYVQRMRTFSDDGATLHGAYGKRWRGWFIKEGPGDDRDMDQLRSIIRTLRSDPEDRRQVLQMWDAEEDLGRAGRDVPCNLTATFQVGPDGCLDMVVFCRSNDLIWGAYGANAVHFSMLQEYVAAGVGRPVGCYWQVSVNWHAYEDVLNKMPGELDLPGTVVATANAIVESGAQEGQGADCPYALGQVQPYPLFYLLGSAGDVQPSSEQREVALDQFDRDLRMLLDEGPDVLGYKDPYVRRVAVPVMKAHAAWSNRRGVDGYQDAMSHLQSCRATDWRLACEQWLGRRYHQWLKAQDDGPSPDAGVVGDVR